MTRGAINHWSTADRLATMTSPLWSGTLTWGYRLDGLLDTRQWPAGSSGQASLTYDGAKRPTAFAKVGTAAASFTQGYDRDGNVVSEGRSLTGVSGDAGTNTQLFGYDGLNRVTGQLGAGHHLRLCVRPRWEPGRGHRGHDHDLHLRPDRGPPQPGRFRSDDLLHV